MPDYTVYKATYSGTPVYEFIAKGIACMRRRSDSWINATQILKVADFDKPQRTRILEREVQRGVHEKVQGGYGKYQGTWVPLDRARAIAAQYNVEDLLMPIFNFRPSTESPPLAPKHITAASTKPRPARAPAARPPLVKRAPKQQPPPPPPPPPPPVIARPPPPPSEDSFDEADDMSEIDPLDDPEASIISSSASGPGSDLDLVDHPSQHSAGMTLKRKRSQLQHHHHHHHHHHDTLTPYDMSSPHHRRISYSDELLDYFMTKDMDVPEFLLAPPPDFDVNEVIDTERHTAIHWAAAMGDLKVIELLVRADADIFAINKRGETPLMRAVLFTNNYDRRSFPRLVETLRETIFLKDKFQSTVFHHIAATTSSRNKLLAARYYNEVLLQKLSESHSMDEIANFLDSQDMHGDTALTISARNVAKKCVRTLLGYNASPDIPNNLGETADRLIIAAEEARKLADPLRARSSSPFDPHPGHSAVAAAINYAAASHIPQPHVSEAAIAATKKVIPLMAEMLEGLATAFDKELHEKEEDHHQAKRLLESSQKEIEQCRQTSADTLAEFGDLDTMNLKMTALQSEADALARELRETLERSQRYELRESIRIAESEEPSPPPSSDNELMERLQAAKELAEKQAERKELIGTIVKAYARSGAGGKMADYRRLIALSCSLLPDDVEKLLPEILRDLEAGGDGRAV